MVFRAISTDIKQRALWLLHAKYEIEEISTILNVSDRSIRRWKRNLELHDHVKPPCSMLQGRPRILTGNQVNFIIEWLKHSPEMFLDEMQDILALEFGVIISRSTLQRNIGEAGLTYKLLRKKAAERNEIVRQLWRDQMMTHFVAEQMVFVDESSKDDHTIYRHYGRALSGQRAEINACFIRGQRYSILPALSTDGYIAVRVLEGSVDGGDFFDFIVQDVLPQMNPYPGDRSVLILDNCAIHKSRHLREVVEEYGCLLRFLPPYSPDFNPIEESFSSIKAWLRRNCRQAQNRMDPEGVLFQAATQITPEKAKAWIRHSGYILGV